MNSLEKLALVLGQTAPPQTECGKIHDKYEKKIRTANTCKTKGNAAAGGIRWILPGDREAGMTEFTWTWRGCATEVGGESFFPEGEMHELTPASTSGPGQDGGGSMRPPRGRGAVAPTVAPPTEMGRELAARQNEEKCKISKEHNEILYSLEVQKETELYDAGCAPYPLSNANRKKKFDEEKAKIKTRFQRNLASIKKRPPCKKS